MSGGGGMAPALSAVDERERARKSIPTTRSTTSEGASIDSTGAGQSREHNGASARTERRGRTRTNMPSAAPTYRSLEAVSMVAGCYGAGG